MYIADVLSSEGRSLQLEAEPTNPNGTVNFTLVLVTNGQQDHVTLNSSGYLTIDPGADDSFYIDVSISFIHYPKTVIKFFSPLDCT